MNKFDSLLIKNWIRSALILVKYNVDDPNFQDIKSDLIKEHGEEFTNEIISQILTNLPKNYGVSIL